MVNIRGACDPFYSLSKKLMTLAQYIYKRINEEQIKFQRDRAKSWPAGLFINSDDIDRYIREYVLTKKGTVSDSPWNGI